MTNTFNTGDPEQALRRLLAAVFGPMITSGGLPTFQPASLSTDPFATEGFVGNTAGDELVYTNQAAAALGPLNQGDGTYWIGLHRDIYTDVSPWVRQASTHYVWQRTGSSSIDTPPPAVDGLGLFAACVVAGNVITSAAQPIPPATRFGPVGLAPDSNNVLMQMQGLGRIVYTGVPAGNNPEGSPIITIDVNDNDFRIDSNAGGNSKRIVIDSGSQIRLQQNGVDVLEIVAPGEIRLLNVKTSATGLPARTLWDNGGVVNITP